MATESHSVALGYAERNRGTFSFGGGEDCSSADNHSQKKGGASVAGQLADRNRAGTIGGVISGGGPDESPKHNGTKKVGTPNTRCNTADARKNAQRNQGHGVKGVFGTQDEDDNGSNTPRMRPEGMKNFEKNKGSLTMDMHDHSDHNPKGRVTPSGKMYAERNLGTLGKANSEENQGATTKRIRGDEAAKNAHCSQGSISEVFKHNVSDCDVRRLKIV